MLSIGPYSSECGDYANKGVMYRGAGARKELEGKIRMAVMSGTDV